jgi:hypothetical protein
MSSDVPSVPSGLFFFAATSTLMMLLSVQRRRIQDIGYRTALSRVGARMASAIKKSLAEAGPESSEAPGGCDGCDVGIKPTKPNNMLGSVKAYDRHVIIYTSDAWESDIDKQSDSFPYSLIRFLEEGKPKKEQKEPKDKEPKDRETKDREKEKEKEKEKGVDGGTVWSAESKGKEGKEGKEGKCKVKLTALHEPTTPTTPTSSPHTSHHAHTSHLCRVLVYPDNLLFSLTEAQLQPFSRLLTQPQPLTQRTLQQVGVCGRCHMSWNI